MTQITGNRALVKAEIVRQVNLQPAIIAAKAEATAAWPGDQQERESIYLAQTTGSVDFPTSMAGRLQRDDLFTIDAIVQSALEGQDATECETACEAYMSALIDVICFDGQLGGFGGQGVPGLIAVQLGDVMGPDAVPTAEGWMALGLVRIHCHSRIL